MDAGCLPVQLLRARGSPPDTACPAATHICALWPVEGRGWRTVGLQQEGHARSRGGAGVQGERCRGAACCPQREAQGQGWPLHRACRLSPLGVGSQQNPRFPAMISRSPREIIIFMMLYTKSILILSLTMRTRCGTGVPVTYQSGLLSASTSPPCTR